MFFFLHFFSTVRVYILPRPCGSIEQESEEPDLPVHHWLHPASPHHDSPLLNQFPGWARLLPAEERGVPAVVWGIHQAGGGGGLLPLTSGRTFHPGASRSGLAGQSLPSPEDSLQCSQSREDKVHHTTLFSTKTKKYPRYIRNMIILSLLLGSTWLLAWLPYSKVLAYLHVLLNGLTGVYILGNK